MEDGELSGLEAPGTPGDAAQGQHQHLEYSRRVRNALLDIQESHQHKQQVSTTHTEGLSLLAGRPRHPGLEVLVLHRDLRQLLACKHYSEEVRRGPGGHLSSRVSPGT